MGAAISYYTQEPTVTIFSTLDTRSQACRPLTIPTHSHEWRFDAALDSVIQHAMEQYEAIMEREGGRDARPWFSYRMTVWVLSTGAPTLDEWQRRIDAAWKRTLRWRKDRNVAKTWRKLETHSHEKYSVFDGGSLAFSFELFTDRKKA